MVIELVKWPGKLLLHDGYKVTYHALMNNKHLVIIGPVSIESNVIMDVLETA